MLARRGEVTNDVMRKVCVRFRGVIGIVNVAVLQIRLEKKEKKDWLFVAICVALQDEEGLVEDLLRRYAL